MLRRKKRGTLTPNNSTLLLHVMPALVARNISKPFAFLLKIGISNNSAQKILRNTAVQVNFQQLTALCLHLNCTPNDLFALRDLTPPANHALHALKSVDEPTPDLASWIATKTLAEIASMMEGKEQGGGTAQPL